MRIYNSKQQPSWTTELSCRQSRLSAVWATVFYSIFLIVAPLVAWQRGHVPTWVACLIGLLPLMIMPMVVGGLTAAFRSSNWRLVMQSDGLLINLRSYQNHRLPVGETIVHIDYLEIKSASRHVARMNAPSGDGTINWSEKSLELTVSSCDLTPLKNAIAAERQRRYVRSYLGGAMTVSGRSNHVPVKVVDDDTIRIVWRSRYDLITPSLKNVLSVLESKIDLVHATTVVQTEDWQRLNDQELDDLILKLVESGETISAASLLAQRRGYSLTDAKAFVDGLTERLGA